MLFEKKIISFDFDNTLYDQFIAFPRWKLIEQLHVFSREHKIIIATARENSERFEVENFIAKYKLPIQDIYFTNQSLKGSLLKCLGVIKHFDDCPYQLKSAKDNGIESIDVLNYVGSKRIPSFQIV